LTTRARSQLASLVTAPTGNLAKLRNPHDKPEIFKTSTLLAKSRMAFLAKSTGMLNLLQQTRKPSQDLNSFQEFLTPSTACYLFPGKISFFYVEAHKVSTSNRGVVNALLHKPCHEQVYSARSS